MGQKLSCFARPQTREISYLLEKEQRDLVVEYWLDLRKHQPDLFANSWYSAVQSCPEIKEMFGLADSEDPFNNAKFIHVVDDIEAFFDKIVAKYGLESINCRIACKEVGARHVAYSQGGFKAFYWDIFTACLLHTFEDELLLRGRRRFEMVMAWRKLIQVITEHMRSGYEEHEVTRYNDNRSSA